MMSSSSGAYAPADAAGRFSVRPRQAPPRPENDAPVAVVAGAEVFDFEELDTDPSERKPGGPMAELLWTASPEVRQRKWILPAALFLIALFLQSVGLYLATRRYARWVGKLMEKTSRGVEAMPRAFNSSSLVEIHDAVTSPGELAMKLLQPKDIFAEMLGSGRGASQSDNVLKMFLDIVLGMMPALWVAAVVNARNLRLWTRTLLAAAVLATLRAALAALTLLPDPLGWEGCQEGLHSGALDHYQQAHQDGPAGILEGLKGVGLIILLWVQDLAFGMRLQSNLVCANSSLSGSCYLSALIASALYDLSRVWVRKLKPHFRNISHVVFALVLTSLVLADALLDLAAGRQLTVSVALGYLLAVLLYQSPALALCTDRLLLHSLAPLAAAQAANGRPAPGSAEAQEEGNAAAVAPETSDVDDQSRDIGDVVVPPCCVPFCWFHGRYFLYPRPASELAQELRAQRQAQAELEQLQAEQEMATRRLLELEAQLEALRSRTQQREAEEPEVFQKRLQARLEENRKTYEQRAANLREQAEKAREERLRLEAEEKQRLQEEATRLAEEEARKLEAEVKALAARQQSDPAATLISPASRRRSTSFASPFGSEIAEEKPDFDELESKVFAEESQETLRLEEGAAAVAKAGLFGKDIKISVMGDFRTIPSEAWAKMHACFPNEVEEAATGEKKRQSSASLAAAKEPLEAATAWSFGAEASAPGAGDFRTLPPAALSRLYAQFPSGAPGPKPENQGTVADAA